MERQPFKESLVKCKASVKRRTDINRWKCFLELIAKMFFLVLYLLHWNHLPYIFGIHKSNVFKFSKKSTRTATDFSDKSEKVVVCDVTKPILFLFSCISFVILQNYNSLWRTLWKTLFTTTALLGNCLDNTLNCSTFFQKNSPDLAVTRRIRKIARTVIN